MIRKRLGETFTPSKFQTPNPIIISNMDPFRRTPIRFTGGKRPVDKLLINVNQTVSTTQLVTTLTTATFPCTIVGLRWMLSTRNAGTGDLSLFWAIILVKDGESINTMATSDGSTLYAPEQNVLVWGNTSLLAQNTTTGPAGDRWIGDTKTMRKLMGGDKLVWIGLATAASASVTGTIQFFCKT